MPFEMETSRTADAAKLAVLWRDKDKSGSGGLPDRLVKELLDGAWSPGDERPLSERETIFTSSKELKSLFGMVADLRAAVAAPGGYGSPSATGPLSPLAPASPDPLDPTPFRGADMRTTLTDIRALTHGRSAAALRTAATAGELASVMAVLLDLKTSAFGMGVRDTQRVGDWLESSGSADDVPFVGTSILQALTHATGRIAELEGRVRDLEQRP